jgi:hypothetical protein
MAVTTEGNYLGDFLKWEEENRYSREKVVFASGNSISLGEVVGKVTSTGKYVPLDTGAADGSETAAGIALGDYDASSADKEGVILARDAIVADSGLVWPDGIASGDKTTAQGQLKSLGIIFREEA